MKGSQNMSVFSKATNFPIFWNEKKASGQWLKSFAGPSLLYTEKTFIFIHQCPTNCKAYTFVRWMENGTKTGFKVFLKRGKFLYKSETRKLFLYNAKWYGNVRFPYIIGFIEYRVPFFVEFLFCYVFCVRLSIQSILALQTPQCEKLLLLSMYSSIS